MVMNFIINGIELSVGLLLFYPFLLSVLYLLKARDEVHPEVKEFQPHFTCIITAYEDVRIAVPLIRSLLKQDYEHFDIVVVADRCPVAPLPASNRVKCIYPSEPLDGKLKSIREGLRLVNETTDYVVIFDPDNVVGSKYLRKLKRYHRLGYGAVQTKRAAKNLDNYIACLDTAGETYKNFIERKIPYTLGSSATIAGSGISVKTEVLKEFFTSEALQKRIDTIVPGDDKMLQNFILEKHLTIAFNEEAVVYDEKVTTGKQVQNQRAKWINAYFENVRPSVKLLFQGISALDKNKILLALNTLYPPLYMLIIPAFILIAADLIRGHFTTASWILTAGLAAFSLNFILALKLSKVGKKVLMSLFLIPVFIINQTLALLNTAKAKRMVLLTEKKKVSGV